MRWSMAKAMIFLVGACGLVACESKGGEETSISPDRTAPPPVAPAKPQPKLVYALVHQGTELHASPHESSESFQALDRLPGKIAKGGAVVFAFDGEQPESAGWVRLVATDRSGRCGYEPLAVKEPVYVKREALMRTLRAPKVIEEKGGARIELAPGVALRPEADDAPGTFTVTTREVRLTLTLPPDALTSELDEALLEPIETAPLPSAAPSGSAAPSSSAAALRRAAAHGMVGLLSANLGPTKLRVGDHEVKLSPRFPPDLSPVEGSEGLSRLDTPCVEAVGKAVERPSPYAALGSDPLSARGNLWGEAIGDSFGVGGLGLSGIGEGGGGRGEGIGLGAVGTMGRGDDGGAVGGYGRGSGRLGRAHKAKPPRLRVGSVSSTRGLDGAIVQRTVRSRSARMRRCYLQGLEREPTLAGAVFLEFSIQLDGHVATARSVPKSASQPQGTDLADGAVVSCVVAALQGVVFPKPEGEVPVKAKVRIAFTP